VLQCARRLPHRTGVSHRPQRLRSRTAATYYLEHINLTTAPQGPGGSILHCRDRLLRPPCTHRVLRPHIRIRRGVGASRGGWGQRGSHIQFFADPYVCMYEQAMRVKERETLQASTLRRVKRPKGESRRDLEDAWEVETLKDACQKQVK